MEFSTNVWSSEFDQGDIEFLMTELHCTEEVARISLSHNNHDPVHALMYLTAILEVPPSDSLDSSMDVDGDSFMVASSDGELVPLNLEPILNRACEMSTPRADITDETTDAEEETCCICMDGFDGTRNTTLKCGHKFHTDCMFENIATAGSNKNMCPLCRTEFCSDIVHPKVDELREYSSVLENELRERVIVEEHCRNAILYMYDKAEQQHFDLMETKRDFKVNDREILALRNALCRSQQNLSIEIVRAETTKLYKKCSQCKCYGHNRRMCMDIPSTFKKEDQSYYYHYSTGLLSSEAVMEAIMPDGVLYDAINEHFEDEEPVRQVGNPGEGRGY